MEYQLSGGPGKSWNPAAAASGTARLTRSFKMGINDALLYMEAGIREHFFKRPEGKKILSSFREPQAPEAKYAEHIRRYSFSL